MSIISNLIFNGAKHYVTSSYGPRGVISTSAGNTGSFHYGTDYGTDNKKIAQYAIEDGEIISCGKDSAANGYALFVWVKYPRINKKFLHYHLDSIAVKAGQKVKKGTLLGYTGMTGRATGIHLHLGVKDLTTGSYEDPEKFAKNYKAPTNTNVKTTTTNSNKITLPKRGYFTTGDKGADVDKISAFLRATFPAYVSKDALGDYFGIYLLAGVKEFQRRTGLVADGLIGPDTLKKMRSYGFKY